MEAKRAPKDVDLEFDEECGECGGEGWIVADCFEDTCCCADPESQHDLIRCTCNPPKMRASDERR
jgi:hypothetical protein